MRVLIAPDSFGSTMTAVEAATAIRDGWLSVAPDDELVLAPLSDGGPGFVDVLATALGGELVTLSVQGPLASPVAATYLRVGDTAYVESAQACGLHLLTPEERDPLRTTTYGVGQLVAHNLDQGAVRVVVGLGGSATNDGGAGMLAALGVVGLDAKGGRVPAGGAAVIDVDHLDTAERHPRLPDVELVAATDVINPLLGFAGASAVYGPQKGATAADTQRLDFALAHWADVLQRDLPGGLDVRKLPGAGAAGGMGAALLAVGATRESGIGLVRDAVGLAEQVASVELVVTGEGMYDWQSRDGKVISGVTQLSIENGLPCVLIAGQVVVGRRQTSSSGLDATYSLADAAGSVQEAMDHAPEWTRKVAAAVARGWSVRR
ncbi:MAG: glycerate 2-kinase, partial [Frankiales bacterium]|nr:glycerate 2-kinase [Frankiales bacterium]